MPQQDLSSPAHRVENLRKHKFVRAYAMLRGLIESEKWADKPISDLRLVCEVLEDSLARQFELPATTLVGMLVDLNNEVGAFKTGSGRAE